MTEITGVCPIVQTPFTENGEVDYESLETELRWLIDSGCQSVTLFGIAGEFYKLSDEERHEMMEFGADVVDGDVPLVASLTEEAREVAVKEARFAEDVGIDCLMTLPPRTLGPSSEDHYRHLRAVGEAVDIPIMVQYAPETAGGTIDLSVFERLSDEIENIDHYKIESFPSGGDISRMADVFGDRINILVGFAGAQMIEAFDRGAVGVIPASGMHDVYLRIYDRYVSGDREGAVELHNDLVPMLNHARQSPSILIHYEKRMLVRRGVIETDYCRAPAFEPDEYYDRIFEEQYERLEPLFDAPAP